MNKSELKLEEKIKARNEKSAAEKKLHWKNLPKIKYALIAVVAVVICLIAFFTVRSLNSISQSVYSISYVVDATPSVGALVVDVTIDITKLSKDSTVMLYKGMMNDQSLVVASLTDGDDVEIPYADTEDVMAIGPLSKDQTQIKLTYFANIGSMNDEESFYGLPLYAQGCLLDDLIAFSGEYAILIPFLDPDTFDSIDKYITGVSFEFNVPEGLRPIIPYQPPIDGQLSFYVEKPDWEFFNRISKSAFCFGQFERYDYDGFFGSATVYVDEGVVNEISQYSLDAVSAFLYFYSDIFGEPLGEVPLTLLRNLSDNDEIITAGVGSGGAAMSINLRLADDFQVMSNMMFHLFFDSKIKPYNLRYKSYDWVYNGLSEFYVNYSINYLPETIKELYSIGEAISLSDRYMRYIYFSLKEPGFLAVAPAHELTGMYGPQEDFYLKVKIPLIIDVINYSINEKAEQPDGFIKELVKRGKTTEALDIEKFLKEVCGGDASVIADYLGGVALIPNIRGFNLNNESDESILYQLDQNEQMYNYLFYQQGLLYPYSSMFLLNEAPFMADVERLGISYNTDVIQNEVMQFSSVIHRLLLQRAMWASFADIDDITLPNINNDLADPEVMNKWEEYCIEIGFEYIQDDYTEYG